MGFSELVVGLEVAAGPLGAAPGRARAPAPGRRSAGAGITLLEVILAAALLGILAAVAVPRLANSAIWAVKGEASAKQVAATLRLARRMAIDQRATEPNGFYVAGSGGSYAVYEADTMQRAGEERHLADGWQFAAGFNTAFDPLGAATGSTGPDAVVVQGHGKQWSLEITASTGAVRYEEKE